MMKKKFDFNLGIDEDGEEGDDDIDNDLNKQISTIELNEKSKSMHPDMSNKGGAPEIDNRFSVVSDIQENTYTSHAHVRDSNRMSNMIVTDTGEL